MRAGVLSRLVALLTEKDQPANGQGEAAFAILVRERADALHVAGDVFFTSRRVQFATLAASYPFCGAQIPIANAA